MKQNRKVMGIRKANLDLKIENNINKFEKDTTT